MPPVMVRSGGYKPARQGKQKKKSKTPKRRYDIALATPGVEIRLPSLPTVRIGWRILSFLLVAGLSALIYYFWTSPDFQIQGLEIKGALRLKPEDVLQKLNIDDKPVFLLDPNQMADDLLLTYPEIRDVTVQIGFPADLVVHLSERVPLILWNQDNATQWIDGDGYAFPPRGEVDQLVSVQAYASPPKPESEFFEDDALAMDGTFEAFMDPELVAAILVMRAHAPEGTELTYDPQYGLGWKDTRGWDVYFGIDGNDIEGKLAVYTSIVNKLQTDGITPAFISLEYLHAPYYRLDQ
jgi:cell division protein FtsQ